MIESIPQTIKFFLSIYFIAFIAVKKKLCLIKSSESSKFILFSHRIFLLFVEWKFSGKKMDVALMLTNKLIFRFISIFIFCLFVLNCLLDKNISIFFYQRHFIFPHKFCISNPYNLQGGWYFSCGLSFGFYGCQNLKSTECFFFMGKKIVMEDYIVVIMVFFFFIPWQSIRFSYHIYMECEDSVRNKLITIGIQPNCRFLPGWWI